MDRSTFIGTGRNPDGPDIPLGLGMQLAQNPKAMQAFGRMSNAQKSELIGYLQSAATGGDAEARMSEVIRKLGRNDRII